MGIEKRHTPETELTMKYEEGKEDWLVLRPGDQVLVKTIEKVNLPTELSANVTMRTTIFRSGLDLRSSPVQPGYKGELTFAIKNDGPATMKIQMGARIAHIQFEIVDGGGSAYRGQQQGGRVSTEKPETQI